MNQTEAAIRNLELAGLFKEDSAYGGMIGEAVKKLLLTHQQERHSGGSHQMTVEIFRTVALGRALTMEFWKEQFDAYNTFAREQGHQEFNEVSFAECVMPKPNI